MAVGLGIASAVLLTACSPGAGAGASSNGTVTLQMVEVLTQPARSKVIRGLLDDFQKANPTIKVNLVSPPTEQAPQKVSQLLQSGRGIDVLEVSDLYAGQYEKNGWIKDMKGDLAGWKGWDALTAGAKAAAVVNGKTYYIPYGFFGVSTFYRKDLLKKAGFSTPPKSWDELLAQAEKIQNPSHHIYGYAFRGGTGSSWTAAFLMETYAIDKIDPNNSYKLKDGSGTLFSTPEAKQALDTYIALFKKASPPSSVAWGYPEMVQGFTNGSTAFLMQSSEVVATVQASSLREDQWSTTPMMTGPSGKAALPLGVSGWGIATKSQHQAAALKLVKFLASPKAATIFSKASTMVPIVQSAQSDPYYSTGPWQSYATMDKNPQTYVTVREPRAVNGFAEWSQQGDQDMQKVLLGKMSTSDLLKSWDKFWTDAYAAQK